MQVPRLKIDSPLEWLDLGLNDGLGGGLYHSGDGDSSYREVIGEIESDRERVAMPGVDGLLVAHHGTRGRKIVLSGALRLSEVGFNRVYSQRDAFKSTTSELTYTDELGAEYRHCEMTAFVIDERQAIQRVGRITLRAEYRIELRQLL